MTTASCILCDNMPSIKEEMSEHGIADGMPVHLSKTGIHPVLRPRNKIKNKAIVAVILMVAVTVVLAGVLYMWVGSLASTHESVDFVNRQEIPDDPTSMSINTTLDVEYKRLNGAIVPFFDIRYHATFGFEPRGSPTVTYIPLPQASIEGLEIELNNFVVDIPEISNNRVRLTLPKNTTNIVEIRYMAKGNNDYRHTIPKNRFIRHLQVNLIINRNDDNDITGNSLFKGSLSPDTVVENGEKIVIEWDKENAVLKKDIIVTLPEMEDPLDSLGTFLVLLIFFMIGESIVLSGMLRRLNRERQKETIPFFLVPFVMIALVVMLSLIYLDETYAALFSILLFTPLMYYILKRMIGIGKGLTETSVIVCVSFSILPVLVFLESDIRVIAVMVLLTALVSTGLLFIKKFKTRSTITQRDQSRTLFQKNVELIKGMRDLKLEREDLNDTISKLTSANSTLREKREKCVAKHFCLFCGRAIKDDFDYCPGCGEDMGIVIKCPKCAVLLSEGATHCPNCGTTLQVSKKPDETGLQPS